MWGPMGGQSREEGEGRIVRPRRSPGEPLIVRPPTVAFGGGVLDHSNRNRSISRARLITRNGGSAWRCLVVSGMLSLR